MSGGCWAAGLGWSGRLAGLKQVSFNFDCTNYERERAVGGSEGRPPGTSPPEPALGDDGCARPPLHQQTAMCCTPNAKTQHRWNASSAHPMQTRMLSLHNLRQIPTQALACQSIHSSTSDSIATAKAISLSRFACNTWNWQHQAANQYVAPHQCTL